MNKDFKVLDLTHTLSGGIPAWDGKSDFEMIVTTDYKDCAPPYLFRVQKINSSFSNGTHMDAPSHVIVGGRTIEQLTMEELVVDAVVIDVSSEADENYLIKAVAIEKFEQQYGEISKNSLVIFYTGWDKLWENPEKYHNNYKFPSLDAGAAELLVKRGIAGVGIDTFSCDTGQNGFPVHNIILGANKYLVENIANAKLLPPVGAKVLVMPTKIKDATEAPVRLVALI